MIATLKSESTTADCSNWGINTDNVAPIVEAGADGISVISAISKSENIEDTVKNSKIF